MNYCQKIYVCDIAPRRTTAATCNISLANANYSTQIVYRMTVDVQQTPHGPHGSHGKPIPSSLDNSAPWGRGGICGSQRLFIAADCSNRTKPVAHGCHAPWLAALMACHGRRPGFTACWQWNCSLSSCDYRDFAMAWIVVSGQTTDHARRCTRRHGV